MGNTNECPNWLRIQLNQVFIEKEKKTINTTLITVS